MTNDLFWSLLDPELAEALRAVPADLRAPLREGGIQAKRDQVAGLADPAKVRSRVADGVRVEERTVEQDGVRLDLLTILPPTEGPVPTVYHLHGGGLVTGDRYLGLDRVLGWVSELGTAIVSAEYRLAPEHPYPAPLDDAVAGLRWVQEQGAGLGLDPARVILAGASAGGGLALGALLRLREAGLPQPLATVLMSPMIDDRTGPTPAALTGDDLPWSATSNELGWRSYLGDLFGSAAVPAEAAPARTADLSGLSPVYIDTGAVDLFAPDCIALAQRLVAAGVATEMHLWPGGFHGFDLLAPHSGPSERCRGVRLDFVRRALAERHH